MSRSEIERAEVMRQIAERQLTQRQTRYREFDLTLDHDKLVEAPGLAMSVETLRQWLVAVARRRSRERARAPASRSIWRSRAEQIAGEASGQPDPERSDANDCAVRRVLTRYKPRQGILVRWRRH